VKTLRQVAETAQGSLGIGVGKAEPYNFLLYRSAFLFCRQNPKLKTF